MFPMRVRIEAALPCLAVFAAVVASVAPAAACPYCRMGADPQTCLDFVKTDRSGALRLDAAIDKFQPALPQAAPLTIVTNASELPARAARRPAVPAAVPAAVPPPAPASSLQTHVVDGGLIGLAVAGGIFCWRTRRPDEDTSARQ